MSYLQKNKKNKYRQGIFIVVTFFLLLCIFIFSILFPGKISSLTLSISHPLWKIGSTIARPFEGISGYFSSKEKLLLENKRLINELEASRVGVLLTQSLYNDNQTLQKLLNRKNDTKSIAAVVLSRPPVSPYDTLILDQGSQEGVSIGDHVITDDAVILGDIVNVYDHTSRVELYSTAGTTLSVELVQSTTTVSAIGRGGGNFEITIPRDVPVSVGESIVSANASQFILGTVGNIDKNDADSFQKIYFRLPITVSHLRWVKILKQL